MFSNARIGLLLSTSSARESHEWEGFQAGVFSYEVRSGMYGAADADSDGYVSYREIAAFVMRANAAILNERFRPDVYARPPRGSDRFLDLRDALHRRIEIDGKRPGHYVLEDELGVRVLDFHNAPDQPVAIIRSSGRNDLFLRRTDDNQEYRVAADAKDILTIKDLDAGAPHLTSRGQLTKHSVGHSCCTSIRALCTSLMLCRGTRARIRARSNAGGGRRLPPALVGGVRLR